MVLQAVLSREMVRSVLETYGRAWTTQNPDLILAVFTEDAIYHERVLKEPYRGHAEIREYWMDKVVRGQANIEFEVVNVYVDGTTAIAEWMADFDDRVQRVRKHMKELAVLEFSGTRIKHLREYWASEEIKTL
jgi:ketosteroid isomerase-like protein